MERHDDGEALGAFAEDTTSRLGAARAWPSLDVGESATSDEVPAETTYLFVIGGRSGATIEDTVFWAEVQPGGATGAWSEIEASTNNRVLAGQSSYLRHNSLFLFGGEDASGPATSSFSANFDGPPQFASFNNLGGSGLAEPRAYAGLALETAYLYLVGGTSTGADALDSVLRQVY